MEHRLPGLDALRGIAALIVAVGVHQHFLLGYYTGSFFAWLHTYGVTMVDLFFVVSGFIFAHVYMRHGRIEAHTADFALARFARLYPLHIVTLVACAAIAAVGAPASVDYAFNDARHFVLNLLMLQDGGLNTGLSFNIPTWSISIEVLCYVLFFVVGRRYHRIALPLAMAFAFIGAMASAHPDMRIEHVARGLCGFFMGTLAWRLRDAPPAFCLALIAGGIGALAWGTRMHPGAALSLTVWPALVILAPRLGVLSAAPLEWLGDRSYSVYLVHAPLYFAINVFVFGGRAVPPGLAAVTVLVAALLALAIADLSFRYLERPARRRIRQLCRQAPAQATLSPIAR